MLPKSTVKLCEPPLVIDIVWLPVAVNTDDGDDGAGVPACVAFPPNTNLVNDEFLPRVSDSDDPVPDTSVPPSDT